MLSPGCWGGQAPGPSQSRGKRLSGKTRPGRRWCRRVLVEAAHIAAKTTQTWLPAPYRRVAARRGKKRTLVALGRTNVLIVYTLVPSMQSYQEPGVPDFDSLAPQRIERW